MKLNGTSWIFGSDNRDKIIDKVSQGTLFFDKYETNWDLSLSVLANLQRASHRIRGHVLRCKSWDWNIKYFYRKIFGFKDYESKQHGINYDTFSHYYHRQTPQAPYYRQEMPPKNLFTITAHRVKHVDVNYMYVTLKKYPNTCVFFCRILIQLLGCK